jgi:hypothetical protein
MQAIAHLLDFPAPMYHVCPGCDLDIFGSEHLCQNCRSEFDEENQMQNQVQALPQQWHRASRLFEWLVSVVGLAAGITVALELASYAIDCLNLWFGRTILQ